MKGSMFRGEKCRKSYRRPEKEKSVIIGDDKLNKSQQHHALTKRDNCYSVIYEENQGMYKEKIKSSYHSSQFLDVRGENAFFIHHIHEDLERPKESL